MVPNKYAGYDTKQFDGETLENAEYFFIAITSRFTPAQSGITW